MHKVSFIQLLPVKLPEPHRGVDGVVAATHSTGSAACTRTSAIRSRPFRSTPEAYLEVYPEYKLTPEEQRGLDRGPRGHDRRAQRSPTVRLEGRRHDAAPARRSGGATDGSDTWDLRSRGIYDVHEGGDNRASIPPRVLRTSARATAGATDRLVSSSRSPIPTSAAGRRRPIDALFANSPAETKTSTEKAFTQSFANQIGNIGAIVTAVASAVFFTMLLVTANTMAQSVRERTNELAVLKTLGFTNAGVAGARARRSRARSRRSAALLGLGLAALVGDRIGAGARRSSSRCFGMPPRRASSARVLMVALGLLAGAAAVRWQAMRLQIVDALRRD